MSTGGDPEVLSVGGLIGEPVVNPAGEELGTIEEIMIDMENGDLAYVVLSRGEAYGLEDRLYAIPWGSLHPTGEGGFLLHADAENIAAGPSFERGHWPRMSERSWAEDIHRYFGQVPYWQRSYYADRPAGPSQMGGHKKPSPFRP